MQNPLNIETLRIASETGGTSTPLRRQPPRPRRREKFLRGPIPLPWLRRAAALKGKALHVAIQLWYEAGLTNSGEVSISMTGMSRMGVSRFAASRGLKALEEAGLVTVVRHAGRKPVVDIVATPTVQSTLPDSVDLAGTNEVGANPNEKSRGGEEPLLPVEHGE